MKNFELKKKALPLKGFSLVELMVSVTIFAIVMLVGTGTVLVMINANSKAQEVHSSISNISFALDNITRELRQGIDYYCDPGGTSGNQPSGTQDCVGGSEVIWFTELRTGARTGYRLGTGGSAGKLQKFETELVDGWIDITSDNVVVTQFDMYVTGSMFGDTEQPQITLYVEAYVNNGVDNDTDFELQTKIVQRLLDQ